MTIAASRFRRTDRGDRSPIAAFQGLLYAMPMSAFLWVAIILTLRVIH